jgi:uncharacterized protein (DUF885 family)
MNFRIRVAIVAAGFVAVGLATAAADFVARYRPVVEQKGPRSDARRLQLLFEIDWAIRLEESPELATYVGSPDHNDRWTDNTRAAIERRRTRAPAALAALHSINRAALGPVDQISYDLFLRQCEEEMALQAFPVELLPLTQLDGIHQNAANLLALAPRGNVSQLEDQLARLEKLPAAIDQAISLLQDGLAHGITHAAVALREVPQQVRNQIVEDPLTSPLLAAFREFSPNISGEDQQRLQAAASATYRETIVPAWRRLETFLEQTYLPRARADIAWTALPGGETWYATLVRQRTTTDRTPGDIHELGLAEVRRIRGEMERVKEQAGFVGPIEQFFQFLRTDPQFYFTDKNELIRAYRDIAKRADGELLKLFGTLPRTPYGVEPVPSYAESSQTTAYYQPGSAAAGRAGKFFANTYALHTRPKWEMEALTLHEAVPGHHLQIALQQEIEGLPSFRRFSWGLTAYVEGWGLYAESLGEEMGFYRDPYSKFGQLTYEMWRAIRLVVDTGMHSQGWSRQQAIDFFKAHAGKTENDIVVEIDRYIVWPGQALAYKIGELKLKELRAFASRELGSRLDVRAFHDEVLRHGALPLDLVERNIHSWVAGQK